MQILTYDSLINRMDKLAKKYGVSRIDVFEAAVEKYLAEQGEWRRNFMSYTKRPSIEIETVLIGNKSEQFQWEISHTKVGDQIDFDEEDDDKLIFYNQAAYDIGYTNKKISRKIIELMDDDYYLSRGEIVEKTKDNEKIIVKIYLLFEDELSEE